MRLLRTAVAGCWLRVAGCDYGAQKRLRASAKIPCFARDDRTSDATSRGVEVIRIDHRLEKERMRRRGRRNVSIVSGVEEPSEIGKRTASCGDVEHCTDEESDHVMQEPV